MNRWLLGVIAAGLGLLSILFSIADNEVAREAKVVGPQDRGVSSSEEKQATQAPCCPLNGTLVFRRRSHTTDLHYYQVVLKLLPGGKERVLMTTPSPPYYQVSPKGSMLLIEAEGRGCTTVYFLKLASGAVKQAKLPEGSRYVLWVSETSISFLQPRKGEVWYKLSNGTMRLSKRLKKSYISDEDYLDYLKRRFRSQVSLFRRAINQARLDPRTRDSIRDKDAVVCFLRTVGVEPRSPLIEVWTDISVIGNQCCSSSNGRCVACVTCRYVKGNPMPFWDLRVIDVQTRQTLAQITKPGPGGFYDLRWLPDNRHIIMTWNRSAEPWNAQNVVCLFDVTTHSLNVVAKGENAFWLERASLPLYASSESLK